MAAVRQQTTRQNNALALLDQGGIEQPLQVQRSSAGQIEDEGSGPDLEALGTLLSLFGGGGGGGEVAGGEVAAEAAASSGSELFSSRAEGFQPSSNTATPGIGIPQIDQFTQGRRTREQQSINLKNAMQLANDKVNLSGVDLSFMDEDEMQSFQGLALQSESAFDARLKQIELSQGIHMTPAQKIQKQRDEVALNRERIELAAIERGGVDPKFATDLANQLRDERRADLAAPRQAMQTAGEVGALLTSGNRSGPVAFSSIFRFIQSQDNSVVRAEDLRTFIGGTGIWKGLTARANEAAGRGFIDDDLARDMLDAVELVGKQQQSAVDDIQRMHNDQAARYMDVYGPGGTAQLPQNFETLTGAGISRTFDFDGEIQQLGSGTSADSGKTVTLDDGTEVTLD